MSARKQNIRSITRLVSAILAALAILSGSYLVGVDVFSAVEDEKSQAKLELYKTTIENELTRLEHLPAFLADDPATRLALHGGGRGEFDADLREISNSAKAEAIYVMDQGGMTIAASNYLNQQTFLGKNYSFRPYFQEAIRGNESTFFAIGATTSRPGYFLAAPVFEGTGVLGVVAIKLDLTALNKVLETTSDNILVTNADDVVVLSSNDAWRYKTISSITQDRLDEIAEERQFGTETLDRLDWQVNGRVLTGLDGQTFVVSTAQLNRNVWTLRYLADYAIVRERALSVVASVAVVLVLFALVFMFWRAARVRKALSASQSDRRRLQREITERRKAEQGLKDAQMELRKSSKMAALGQLSASVTHELGQPISAMKNHIAAEEISNSAPSPVLQHLSGIVDRMERTTQQLRSFSTIDDGVFEPVSLDRVVSSAVSMMHHDLLNEGVSLQTQVGGKAIKVNGSQQKLEQVLINLMRNSAKAMQDREEKELTVTLSTKNNDAVLSVRDTGTGLLGQSLDQLVEPFHTTRSSGEGMGLGLAISASIVEEHHGKLEADDRPDGGAEFRIILPLAENVDLAAPETGKEDE